MPWAIRWRENSRLDGKREWLMGRFNGDANPVPARLSGYTTMVFATRAEARAYIKDRYGYIARRSDLRTEPYGWKMPVAVRIKVSVETDLAPERRTPAIRGV